jgi:CPA2 family monovalent cation:H+ antiporter-2
VAALSLLVIFGKLAIALALGLLLPHPARTFAVVAVGLSQIGEFSFILGEGGLDLNLLNSNQYSLILAAALISITVNPFMYRMLPALEGNLKRVRYLQSQFAEYRANVLAQLRGTIRGSRKKMGEAGSKQI